MLIHVSFRPAFLARPGEPPAYAALTDWGAFDSKMEELHILLMSVITPGAAGTTDIFLSNARAGAGQRVGVLMRNP